MPRLLLGLRGVSCAVLPLLRREALFREGIVLQGAIFVLYNLYSGFSVGPWTIKTRQCIPHTGHGPVAEWDVLDCKIDDKELKRIELQKNIEEKRAEQLKKREDLIKANEAKRLQRIKDIEDAKKAKEQQQIENQENKNN